MAKIQRLKAPEGWPVLAPYAAILLDDESLKTIQKDGDITAALDRLKKWREQRRPDVEALIERLDTLMADIQQANPVADILDFLEGVSLGQDRRRRGDLASAQRPRHVLRLHLLRRPGSQDNGTRRSGDPQEDLGEGRRLLPPRSEDQGGVPLLATAR